MTKTDLELQSDVMEELAFEPSVDAAGIGVSAKNGIVTLTGYVRTFAEKSAAERAAKRVAGVRGIAEEIDVHLPDVYHRTDAEIAAAALSAIAWNASLPRDTITAKVESGWVTLEGTVPWQYQKDRAKESVEHLLGVRGVSNLIGVKAAVAPQEVREKIVRELHRTASADANALQIETTDGKVTLRGRVRSWAELADATRAAYSVPGVTKVENLATVGATM